MNNIQNWLTGYGISTFPAEIAGWVILSLGVLLLSFFSNLIAKKLILKVIAFVVKKSKAKWDDILLEHKVFSRLSHIAPALVIYFCSEMFNEIGIYLQRFSFVYMAFAGLSAFNAFLNAIVAIYRNFEMSKQRPIKSYVQVIKIIVFIFIAIIALATLMGQQPWALLTGFGAMTAVFMLVFKDSILGLVAGIQLSTNNMVQIGDWIEVPQYGADGDVIDITLHTVIIQNWDKTISSIPAYSLISGSFKNWRGMSDSGGRRIKRSINIDMSSIKFCDEEMLSRFTKIQHISEYIASKQNELNEFNNALEADLSNLVNGRRMTNIGTLRAYIIAYLKNHPKIHQKMTFLVRQLAPCDNGLPLEIYVFSNDQDWVNYEAIQADVFDHLIATIPLFDLRVFQNPTGYDFTNISGRQDIENTSKSKT
ncbi:MAG: mechanosensitive ion channel [candidate division Zixibacteria bacterium]|nr:mechanosensitive ion channel [candidate division Zixibacteria bacterium]